MPIARRSLLKGGAGLAVPAGAQAQSGRPLRIVVPYPPGGGADLLARALAAEIGGRGGRAVIVENRPGATGTIGAAAAARAAPDGETVLQADAAPMSILPLANRLPYGPADFEPVARLATSPVLLAARADGPLRSLADVIRAARADPGGVTYATFGILSHFHLAMEQFSGLAGVELTHVPFQGTAPGVTAVLAGQVALLTAPPGTLQDQPGLRPIASMTAAPVPGFAGLPTFRAEGIDLVYEGWRGLFAPRGTPADRIAALDGAVAAAFTDPAFLAAVRRLGETPAFLGAADFARFWEADRAVVTGLLPRLPKG
ncbi:Bug family tripartite tricarboxylate transporter substrate binding protein [Falsiroseomonas sp. HW251]|uniref:Bug family tripartite tricarboxylate transporter substrate binding protein n=1 Tax=Falsiroseomonas sp. HW251 TaxID=3390998 RepID=UPI003D311BCA